MEKDKKGRYIEITNNEKNRQIKVYNKIQKEMKERFIKGYNQYGNYTIKTSKENAIKEFREEIEDSMNHLFLLYYRILKDKRVK